MNTNTATTRHAACSCTSCIGADCRCGCQATARQQGCACGANCRCGDNCRCARR